MSIVYFVQSGDNGPIKIGVALDMARRMPHLQNGNPVELHCLLTVPGDQRLEVTLHRAFRGLRIRNEWFHGDPELTDAIDRMRGLDASGVLALARQLLDATDRSETARCEAAKALNPIVEHHMQTAVGEAVKQNGLAVVAETMGISRQSVRNAARRRSVPSAHAFWNLAALDPGLVGRTLNIFGLDLVREARP